MGECRNKERVTREYITVEQGSRNEERTDKGLRAGMKIRGWRRVVSITRAYFFSKLNFFQLLVCVF